MVLQGQPLQAPQCNLWLEVRELGKVVQSLCAIIRVRAVVLWQERSRALPTVRRAAEGS